VTLIEAIVAIVIVSVAAPPLLVALREAHRHRTAPVQADRARWLAAERLEQVIADRNSSVRGWAYLAESNYPAESGVEGFQGFSRVVQIRETGASLSGTGSGYKVVTVRVSWADAGGSKSAEVATVLTEYPS
jgi:Tfp pilus assembly protein PilV